MLVSREAAQNSATTLLQTLDIIEPDRGIDAAYSAYRDGDGAASFRLAQPFAKKGSARPRTQGRRDEPRSLFDRIPALANDLGLLSEEYNVAGRHRAGNFPRAQSYLYLINFALGFSGSIYNAQENERISSRKELNRNDLHCGSLASQRYAMQQKLLFESHGQRIFALIFETGDEVLKCLQSFVKTEKICAAQMTAIGAFSDLVLKYFDWERKEYLRIPVTEQVEVASLIGDVAQDTNGEPTLHLHLVIGKRDGSAMAGHLGEAHVRPTLEVILTESPTHLRKVMDPQSGLALIRPAAT